MSAHRIQRTALVMAGGTGGHIFPGIAIANALQERGWLIEWIGTPTGMENQLVPKAGFKLNTIEVTGVRGKGIIRWLALPFTMIKACKQASALIEKTNPHVVIGIGGYMSVPGGIMAKLKGRPLVVLEPGARAGLANRLLALFASKTLVGFSDAFEKRIDHPLGKILPLPKRVEHTGTPLRAEISATPPPILRFAGRKGPLKLLVVGGSLGAQTLNDLIVGALARTPGYGRPQVTHQAGQNNTTALIEHYKQYGIKANVTAFIDDMSSEYASCDILICRAGAITVAEIAAIGVAAILVPLPWVVGDEQKGNAQYLVDHDAGILIDQKNTTADALAKLLLNLNREKLLAMASNARLLGKPKATSVCADICEGVALAS
jgi:UDP-N-acetylglucosamine--N-acetylmuramyl-(pentapeptide) pyrophosphoryl-undecaprenol N-acetylglucosamine transferase